MRPYNVPEAQLAVSWFAMGWVCRYCKFSELWRSKIIMMPSKAILAMFLSACLAGLAVGQQGAATGPPLAVRTTTLPKAFLRQPFRFQLQAEGGIAPLKWEVTDGALPGGVGLSKDGMLSGAPSAPGEFHFTVTVTDSGRPAYQRSQALTLLVVSPLFVEWSRYPRITGQRIEGAIKASNDTAQDFDLTVIVVAVNETGRATALGYQHFKLKKNAREFEIAFGETLPYGTYEVNVDAVAEVAPINQIYRARLVTKEKLQVKQGP
ncbi:MAG: Ig domain-containing protein [Acidobacteriia bacterium]|nr:Ig domain-containing protein [Terriglobia bacterium]